MRKINKIVLSVSCVGVAMLLFYLGQQKSMIKSIISDNVEELVDDEWVKDGKTYTHLHTISSPEYTTTRGYHSRIPMSSMENTEYWCGTWGACNDKNVGECVIPVVIN